MNERNDETVERYNLLFKQIEGLITNSDPTISSLSNVTASIKQSFSKISWVGFYFISDNNLFLGPFQGGVACTRIKFGQGVCGTAAISRTSQVVTNVHEYPGHIACDAETNSEIVIPLLKNNSIVAVLDLDSKDFAAFNETDKIWLENICNLITEKLNFKFLFS